MNFTLTESQLMIQAAAREFAQNEIAPIAVNSTLPGTSPRTRSEGNGFMGVEVREYGGAGLDSICYVLMIGGDRLCRCRPLESCR